MSLAEVSEVGSRSNTVWFIRWEGQGDYLPAGQHALVVRQQLKEVVASLA